MAFIFADPFASYTLPADMAKSSWGVGIVTFTPTGGRFGLGAANFTGGSSKFLDKSFPAAIGSFIISFDAKFAMSGSGDILEFYNNSGVTQCARLDITPADAVQIRNVSGAVAATSAASAISRTVWHRIEIKIQIGDDTGDVEVWVDGASVLTASGIDFDGGALAGCDRIRFFNDNGGFVWDMGSPIISDTSGLAPWNVELGDKRMYVLLPTADDTPLQWTPNVGLNFDTVNDPIPAVSDGDSTYVQHSAASDAIDLYGYADLPVGIVGIIGVIVDIEARKTDAGALPGGGSLRAQIKHSASTTDGALYTLTTDYMCHQHMFPDVPGGSGWTKTQVDAAISGPFFDVP